MKKFTYTQEYFLCAVSGKGTIPAVTGGEAATCLVVSGITELMNAGLVALSEKEKIMAGKEWDGKLPHLKPLYDKIAAVKRSLTIADFVVGVYNPKQINELICAVGTTLVEAGYVDEIVTQARTKKNYKYVPKTPIVKEILERVREGFLGEGKPDEQTACLTALLDNAGFIREQFNKVEAETIKRALREMQKTGKPAKVRDIMDICAACAVVIMGGGW
jgi:hypothetical protein